MYVIDETTVREFYDLDFRSCRSSTPVVRDTAHQEIIEACGYDPYRLFALSAGMHRLFWTREAEARYYGSRPRCLFALFSEADTKICPLYTSGCERAAKKDRHCAYAELVNPSKNSPQSTVK